MEAHVQSVKLSLYVGWEFVKHEGNRIDLALDPRTLNTTIAELERSVRVLRALKLGMDGLGEEDK